MRLEYDAGQWVRGVRCKQGWLKTMVLSREHEEAIDRCYILFTLCFVGLAI